MGGCSGIALVYLVAGGCFWFFVRLVSFLWSLMNFMLPFSRKLVMANNKATALIGNFGYLNP